MRRWCISRRQGKAAALIDGAQVQSLPRSRKEARDIGAKHYFTGKPCKRGHIDVRRAGDLTCVACGRAYARERWSRNPEKVRRWKSGNAERVREASRRWKRRHPEKVLSVNAARRALKAQAFVGDRKEYIAFLRWARSEPHVACAYCQADTTPGNREIDHKIPLSRGGADSVENLWVACPRCNARKSNRTAEEFFALLEAALR